jgi:glycerophosphoryl diester phosphodiesterase
MALPQLIAHRGHAAAAPENTLAALESAIAAGARFVEVDVQLSRDLFPVLFHDRTLERMCGVQRAVHELTLAELRALTCGEPARFGRRFEREGIASLAGFVQLLARHPAVSAFVEVKRVSVEQFGRERILERVLPALDRAIRQCALISFSLDFLLAARAAHPIPLGVVIERWEQRLDPRVAAIDPEFLFVDVDGLPAEGRLEHGRAQIAVYEVADPALARALQARGVNLVETFAVADMLAALGGAPA